MKKVRMNAEECKYEYWLAALEGISRKKKILLWENEESAKNIYNIEESKLSAYTFLTDREKRVLLDAASSNDIAREYVTYQEQQIRCIPFFDEAYPERLREIPDPPYALFVKGKLPDENRPSAAVIGARRCSRYGELQALRFAEVLAQNGVQIISGMARGVDGAGHRGALNADGESYGVLGCGVDICYPKENMGLYTDLQHHGGILSELPPGTPPLKQHFPARNRIISGLADVVLVIEAKEKSGSLITADTALEQGKEVYALPGPVTSELSRGCGNLIRQGAGILLSPEELLSDWKQFSGTVWMKEDENNRKNKKVLESAENMVYSRLDLYPKSISQLADETGLPPSRLLEQLMTLTLRGYVREVSRNHFIKEK